MSKEETINRREFMIAMAGGVIPAMAGDKSGKSVSAKQLKSTKDKKIKVSLIKTSDKASGDRHGKIYAEQLMEILLKD